MHWARYTAQGEPPVRVHWPGLNDDAAIEAIDGAHWDRYAVNNNNAEEVAVYLRVLWQLVRGREVLGAAVYYAADAAAALGQPGSAVRWQYETDAEGPPGYVSRKGFVPARSSVQIRPTPTPEQKWIRDKSLLFRIHDVREAGALLRSTLGDAAGEVYVFGTSEYRALEIIERLRGETCPELEQLLQSDDIFVDLGIGVDFGYNDYFLAASRAPIRPILAPIVEKAERAIARYEERVNAFTSPAAVLALLAELAGDQ